MQQVLQVKEEGLRTENRCSVLSLFESLKYIQAGDTEIQMSCAVPASAVPTNISKRVSERSGGLPGDF